MSKPKKVVVTAVEKMLCMCGPQKCHHCGRLISSTCTNRVNHCPSCGAPLKLAQNQETKP